MVYSMVGGEGGSINLTLIRYNLTTGEILYNKTVNVEYGCSANKFE